jgi:peptidyl-prolyl cis-trans isomerase SurA
MKVSMQKQLVHSFLTASLVMGFAMLSSQIAVAQQDIVPLDRVVAIVDEDVVLESEFNARKASVLEQLIIERVELGLAKRYEIEIEESEVDDAMSRVLQKNGINQEQLEASLAQQGMSLNGLRNKLRNELTISQLQQGVVSSRIKISERDIDNFLATTDGKFAISADYHIGHILIAVPSEASESEIAAFESQANAVYKQLSEGAEFAQMAITHSKDQAALNGGDIGWRKLAELPELFSAELAKLQPGSVSKPFRSGAGFHILKWLNKPMLATFW